jgi:hypothetical protein
MTRCFRIEFDGLSVMVELDKGGEGLEVVAAHITCLDSLKQTNLSDYAIDSFLEDPVEFVTTHYLNADGGEDYIFSLLPL